MAVTKFAEMRLAKVVTESWVMFAPVDTLSVWVLLPTTFKDWILAVTRLALTKFAIVVTESLVIFATCTFPVTTFAVRIFAVRTLAEKRLVRVLTVRVVIFAPEFTFKIEILLETTFKD